MPAGYQKFFRGEACDHFMASFSDDDFFLDPSGTPAIRRGPKSLQRKHHARLDLARMLQRHQAADYRLLPDGEANAVAVLQRESRLLIGKTELLRFRPHSGDLGGSAARAHEFNRRVEIFPATLVSIVHRMR